MFKSQGQGAAPGTASFRQRRKSLTMDDLVVDFAKKCKKYDPTDPTNGQKDISVQLVLSLALGVSAFVAFCILRPKWKSLYAARKRQSDAALTLPELPDTFFGWMPILYKVTEEEVLASAGLDAYVFLSFFKMSIKLFGIMFLVASIIMAPINNHFNKSFDRGGDDSNSTSALFSPELKARQQLLGPIVLDNDKNWRGSLPNFDNSYLWAYLVFTYLFTALTVYFIRSQTLRIIRVRQDYLGSQSTITDRTIKLSGIPKELRSEEKIKQLLEKLEIGKVDSVTICKDWRKLDALMDRRSSTLRRLEEAWTEHLGRRSVINIGSVSRQSTQVQNGAVNENGDGEQDNLLGEGHITSYENPRPTTRLRYGFLGLQSKKIDAIDYYEEQLRKVDEKIREARKKDYEATPVAFVTMDSIPASTMAVQALLDPSPGQLLAKLAPAPSDIVWYNTYLSRSSRMIRSWTISVFILVLTVFWLFPVLFLAGLLDLCSIQQVWPQLADVLDSHAILKSLVQTGLPTLVVSLLNVAVPFLYDYLANLQGMVSQSDVELSVISKNFFFTFFNVFLVFTIGGSASKFWPALQESLTDNTKIAYQLANSVKGLGAFYTNFILLQSVGLMPFRLLEFGSVSLYPIMRMGSKTPRDYAELVQPPIFKYGFYLPSAILVFILCLVYSIVPRGYQVLFFGLVYFIFGYYTYKYQLLYAMDHPQHATGGAWPMLCYRIMVGLGVFQLVMAGLIALEKQFVAAALVIPLLIFTVWYSYYYSRTYEPLQKYIALRSIRRESNPTVNIAEEEIGIHHPPGIVRRSSRTLDEFREEGLTFINPSLVVPLEKVWINKKPATDSEPEFIGASNELEREESGASNTSLGDTHIWRENNNSNV